MERAQPLSHEVQRIEQIELAGRLTCSHSTTGAVSGCCSASASAY